MFIPNYCPSSKSAINVYFPQTLEKDWRPTGKLLHRSDSSDM